MTGSIMRSICTQEQRTWVGSNLPDPSWCISLFLFGQLTYLYTDKSQFNRLSMKRYEITLICLLLCLCMNAQEFEPKEYSWQAMS